jgi:hypothetical protein
MTGLALILLLVIPGDARFVAATADDGIAQVPVVNGDGSWLRIRMNLSGSHDVVSGYPDIAMSDDGNYVAVVWAEGYDDVFDAPAAKHRGRIYLRWISENSGIWSPKIMVDEGANTADDYATDAAVALQGTMAHVVWVRVWNASTYAVMYRQCVLGGACNPIITLSGEPTSGVCSSPDVVADDNGNVFVVWAREAIPYRAIRYGQFNGLSWSVEPISENNTVNDWPTVAVRNGIVYTAWIRTVSGQWALMGREKSSSGPWSNSPANLYTIPSSPSRYPRLTAGSSAVYLVWETLQTGSKYQVNYKYNTGSGWQPLLSNERKGIPATDTSYTASTSGDEYLQYLRPALALDSAGHLHAVWHHYDSAGEDSTFRHQVRYSYSGNPTAATSTWSPPQIFAELGGDEDWSPEERRFQTDNVSARIAVGGSEADHHIHIVLTAKTGSAWDVWYLSNQLYKNVSLPMVTKNW